MFRVSAITVTRSGDEYLVTWVWPSGEHRQFHCSLQAARRHVRGLLRERVAGLSVNQVLTVNLD